MGLLSFYFPAEATDRLDRNGGRLSFFFLKLSLLFLCASVYLSACLCACVCPCTLLATPPRPEELLIQRPESSEVTVMFYWRRINLETEAVYSELR